jgi:hypothetical protein
MTCLEVRFSALGRFKTLWGGDSYLGSMVNSALLGSLGIAINQDRSWRPL